MCDGIASSSRLRTSAPFCDTYMLHKLNLDELNSTQSGLKVVLFLCRQCFQIECVNDGPQYQVRNQTKWKPFCTGMTQ